MTPEAVYAGVSRWLAAQRRRKRRRLKHDSIVAIESIARAAGGSEGGGGGGGGDDTPGGAGSDAGAFTADGEPNTGGGGGGGEDPGDDGESGGGDGGDPGGGGGVTATELTVDYATDPDWTDVPSVDLIPDVAMTIAAAMAGMPASSVSEPTPIGGGPSPWADNFNDATPDTTNYDFVGTWTEALLATGPSVAGGGVVNHANSSMVYKGHTYEDFEAQFTLVNGINATCTLIWGVDDPANPQTFYTCRYRSSNGVTVYKVVAGVATLLDANAAATIGANDVCGVSRVNDTWTIYKNGVAVLSGTDSEIGAGYVGLAVGSTSTIPRFGGFSITPL